MGINSILSLALHSRTWPVAYRYIITTLCVLIAFFLRNLLFSGAEGTYPFLLFYPVVIGTSLFLDRGNGVYATALSTVFLVIGNAESDERTFDIAVLLFVVTNLIVAIFLEALHKIFENLAQANKKISAAANIRGVLLKELSHRTRNDMAAMNSLFQLQAHSLEDPRARQAFKGAADRMQIIARVHERLSIDASTLAIDSKPFISDLADDLRLSALAGKPIALELSLESLPITHPDAVAMGLIVNELITNAAKYAFPEGRSGRIRVEFRKNNNLRHLRVADDGVGTPENPEKKGSGLGLELVRTLAAQLGGKLIRHETSKGTDFEVVFQPVSQ